MNALEKKVDELAAVVKELAKKVDTLAGVPVSSRVTSVAPTGVIKQITLPEIAREAIFDNGQRRIAAIVGYFEKIKGQESISSADIREGWRAGKFPGSYSPVYLHRAIKEGIIRQKDKNSFDLSQSGEDFLKEIYK